MGLPGHRRTSGDKRRRAAHFALKENSLGVCAKCGKTVLPHRVCAFCGNYKGRQVIKKNEKKLAKKSTAKK